MCLYCTFRHSSCRILISGSCRQWQVSTRCQQELYGRDLSSHHRWWHLLLTFPCLISPPPSCLCLVIHLYTDTLAPSILSIAGLLDDNILVIVSSEQHREVDTRVCAQPGMKIGLGKTLPSTGRIPVNPGSHRGELGRGKHYPNNPGSKKGKGLDCYIFQ